MGNLYCKIECLRQRMHVVALEKGISHSDVLEISRILDQAINEYYKTSWKQKNKNKKIYHLVNQLCLHSHNHTSCTICNQVSTCLQDDPS